MVRSDVTRYLEFRSVNRLLSYKSDADRTPPAPPSSTTSALSQSSRLVKVRFEFVVVAVVDVGVLVLLLRFVP